LYPLNNNILVSAITPTIIPRENKIYMFIPSSGIYFNLLIIKKYLYELRLGETVSVPNTSVFLRTTLAVASHVAEGQLLLHTERGEDLVYQAGTRRPAVPKRECQTLGPK
jgi:hypothetical protein